ncbi:ras guanine nucleotide exchange factor domain-containing protein, partial [Halteromyces radiatus]|uniref:ras guanine nucleotide exchange factor domain-containing protein n=1 Tax=Halteromyces radiatus TaxID=101107 RepID=UPI002220EC40
MKSKSKKQALTSPTGVTTTPDEHRIPTSALSYLKHRLFHSSKPTVIDQDLTEKHIGNHSTTSSSACPTTSSHLDIPKTNTTSTSLALERPVSKSLENDMLLQQRPTFLHSFSDLHSSPDSKTTCNTTTTNRASQIIWKEGYLYKRTDFRPFHTHKSDRGWKLYRVILRGHKLYLYRISQQQQDHFKSLRTLLVSSSSSSSASSLQLVSQHSPSISSNTLISPSSTFTSSPGMTIKEKCLASLNPKDFDDQAKQELFSSTSQDLLDAAVFTEWDRQRKQTATAVYLLIYSDRLVVCKKRKQISSDVSPLSSSSSSSSSNNDSGLWHIFSSTPLSKLTLAPCRFASGSSSPTTSTAPLTVKSTTSSSLVEHTNCDKLTTFYGSPHHDSYFPSYSSSSSTATAYSTENSTQSSGTATLSTSNTTRVNRFTLSYIAQPWKQSTYVSLSKDLVSSWMTTFYEAQQTYVDKKNDMTRTQLTSIEAITDDEKKMMVDSGSLKSAKAISSPTDISMDIIYFEQASPHPGLVLHTQDDRPVQGGTVPALVHELLFETQNQGKEYTYAFLLTYNIFASVGEVSDLMKGYLDRLENTSSGVMLWNRVLDLYRIWCVRFAYDVVGDLVTSMMERLDSLAANQDLPLELRNRGKDIKALVLQTVQDNQHIIEHAQARREYNEGTQVVDFIQRYVNTNETDHSPMMESQTSNDDDTGIDLSDLVATGLSPSLFLTMDPDRLAEQIYVFHHTQHYHHRYQLLSALSYVSRPQVPPQMLNTLLFTSPSPHFLTRLIWRHILVEANMQQTENAMVLRTSLLEHWIRVGVALMKLKDMTGWCSVAMGICSMEIARLKEAWKTVDRSLVKIVSTVWSPLLAEHGIYSLDVWMEGWEHDSRLQHAFSQVLDQEPSSVRSLPYFGVIKQSVDRLRRHVPLHLSCKQTNRLSSGMDVINFISSWCVHDTIRSGLGTWKKGRHLTWGDISTTKGCLPFPIVRPLQVYFDTIVNQVSSVPHDFKYLHECSLLCEPRIFGQALVDRPSKEVAGPAHSPLIFPDTVDSC